MRAARAPSWSSTRAPRGSTPTHVLLTHHHYDHVSDLAAITDAFAGIEVLIHPSERDLVDGATGTMDAGQTIQAGGLEVRTLHTPGHTKGMLALVADGDVFTGDTLFRRSVGGVRAPESTSYDDLKRSVMETLMGLDHALRVQPGHTDPSTIGEEWEHNPFIRLWRGLDEEGTEQVHRARRAGDARPRRARLRRRHEGVGALARRARRHRARVEDRARLAPATGSPRPCPGTATPSRRRGSRG